MRRIVLSAIVVMMMTSMAFAQDKATMYLQFSALTGHPTFVNAENEMLQFRDSDEPLVIEAYDGNMTIYDYSYIDETDEGDENGGLQRLIVNDSDSFTITPTSGELFADFYIRMFSKKHERISVYVQYAKRIDIVGNSVTVASEPGSTCAYEIAVYSPKQKVFFLFTGKMIGAVSARDSDKGMVFSGDSGVVNVSLSNKKDSYTYGDVDNYFYAFGGDTIVTMKNQRPVIKNGILLNKKTTKIVTCLYLRPANSGKNMFLTWNLVKGAKSYVLYRYDTKKKKYKKVAIRNSNAANYYNIPKADAKERYMYYLRAKKKPDGKGKDVCKRSYPVWAVAKDNVKGNATKVTTNRKTIKGKPGKKVRLKATAKTNTGKRLLSKRIRWYCSNKKIASVGRNTGKVKLKKKGKCEVWAKAHNGVNSRKIKITVK